MKHIRRNEKIIRQSHKSMNHLHNSIRWNKEEIMEDILSKLYEARQNDLECQNAKEREEIKEQLNEVTIEMLQTMIEENIPEQNKQQEILKKLEKLIENYEIKMAFYMEKRYKQGFKDAVRFLKQCET